MNFALILFLATLVTGLVALADMLVFAKGRAAGAREPWWVEYPKSFFPVLLIVFLLRSFIAEPFKIPSSSMRPTLEVGDFILVNKFSYGIRLPIVEQKIIALSDPRRGDVMVFRYPLNPSQDFIKRVIGLPGDTVAYREKRLTVNGVPWQQKPEGTYSYLEGLRFETMAQFSETVDGRVGQEANHAVAVDPTMASVSPGQVRAFPGRENCDYNPDGSGFACKVPAGHYFVMGDNRDRSDDGRYWGFVPDDHLRGRAFFIWFNWDDISGFAFKRVGSGIR
jgi:signal peptidase I